MNGIVGTTTAITPNVHYLRSCLPSVSTMRRCITASFSSGFSEQVEYTRRPPTDSISTPRRKIRNWILQHITDNLHYWLHFASVSFSQWKWSVL